MTPRPGRAPGLNLERPMDVNLNTLTNDALANLTPTQASALWRRYGIGRAAQSLEEISLELDIDAEEAQRIINEGLRLLRQ